MPCSARPKPRQRGGGPATPTVADRFVQQGALFPEPERSSSSTVFDLPDAELCLHRDFIATQRADELFGRLRRDTPWTQQSLVMYGREVKEPRLTAWYGDPTSSYVYSGVHHAPLPWTDDLRDLRCLVEARIGESFNSVHLNYYRDGEDSVAWHADDERELGDRPVIASLSFGATRVFQLKHTEREDLERVDIDLPAGSLLVMAGDCQRWWRHQVPKRRPRSRIGGRINLTFRRVVGTGRHSE